MGGLHRTQATVRGVPGGIAVKILIANCHFAPDSFGGATVVAEETATRLADMGHDVVVFTSTSDGDLETHQLFRYESAGIPVVAIKVPERRTLRSEYDDPGVTRQFRQLLDAVRPDVVHVHAIQALGVGILRAAQERGIPTVVTAHDAWWLCERQFMVRATGEFCDQSAIDARVCATCVPDPVAHQMRQQTSLELLNRCDRVLAPSAYWRDLLVASGVRADIAAVNSNGVSRPRPGWRRSPRRGPVRLGYVGALSPAKGYPQLVDALRMLQRSDYELVVVDSFSTLGFVTMSHTDWPVPGLVTIRGAYDSQTMDAFFDGVDALLFPSQWKESYGLTVREAALRGVWPILPDGGGTEDHILTGRNGTVYRRDGGAVALAGAIGDYLDRFADLAPETDVNSRIPTYDEQTDDLVGHLEAVAGPVAAPRIGAVSEGN